MEEEIITLSFRARRKGMPVSQRVSNLKILATTVGLHPLPEVLVSAPKLRREIAYMQSLLAAMEAKEGA